MTKAAPERKYTPWFMASQHTVAIDRLLLAIANHEAPVFIPGVSKLNPCSCMQEHNKDIDRVPDEVIEPFGRILERLDEAFDVLSRVAPVCAEATSELSEAQIEQLKKLLPFAPTTFDLLSRGSNAAENREGGND